MPQRLQKVRLSIEIPQRNKDKQREGSPEAQASKVSQNTFLWGTQQGLYLILCYSATLDKPELTDEQYNEVVRSVGARAFLRSQP